MRLYRALSSGKGESEEVSNGSSMISVALE